MKNFILFLAIILLNSCATKKDLTKEPFNPADFRTAFKTQLTDRELRGMQKAIKDATQAPQPIAYALSPDRAAACSVEGCTLPVDSKMYSVRSDVKVDDHTKSTFTLTSAEITELRRAARESKNWERKTPRDSSQNHFRAKCRMQKCEFDVDIPMSF